MNDKDPKCAGCPLQHHGKGFVQDEVRDVPVAVMAFCPSKDDVQGRRLVGYAGKGQPIYETGPPQPFIGPNGWLLTQTYLPAAGLSREGVSLHHLLKCHVPQVPNWDTLLMAMNHCTKHHLDTSDETKVLVTLGEEPWKLFNGPLPISDWRGFLNPKKIAEGKCDVYCTLDPATLYGDPHSRFITRLDWKKLRGIQSREYPLPIPPQCVASPSTRSQFVELLEEALCQEEIMVDSEYIVDSRLMTHVGAAWRTCPEKTMSTSSTPISQVRGFQLEWVHGSATSVERAIFMKYWPLLCRKVKMGFWNAKADLPILKHNLGDIPDRIEDPMQAHSVLWTDMPHDYEFVASIYGKYPKLKHLSKENILLYHWGDVIDLVWIWEALKDEFKKEPACERKYREQNLKLIPIILEREAMGIKTNQARIEEAIPQYESLSRDASALAQAYCGFPINMGSTSQIRSYLQSSEDLRLPDLEQDTVAKFRTKFYPFEADKEDKEGFSVGYVCGRVALGAHPLLETRVMYAKNEKIINSYLGPLRGVERIYPQINFHTQKTGRHSTTDPALVTFPDGIRDTVMPDPGQTWIGFDWDAQEPRIQWGESGSKVLERAFTKGEDIHTAFLCDLFGWERPQDLKDPHKASINADWRALYGWEGKDDPRRVYAKQVRYEINYDHTEKAYNAQQKAIRMGIEPGVAKRAATVLLNSDPELRDWFRRVMQGGERTRTVRSWDGGRQVYYWADGFSKVPLNEMRNYPLQAGGAGLYNLTIVEVREKVPYAKFVYGSHDSQKWSVPSSRWEEAFALIKPIVEQARKINGRMIPFTASWHLVDDKGVVTKL